MRLGYYGLDNKIAFAHRDVGIAGAPFRLRNETAGVRNGTCQVRASIVIPGVFYSAALLINPLRGVRILQINNWSCFIVDLLCERTVINLTWVLFVVLAAPRQRN